MHSPSFPGLLQMPAILRGACFWPTEAGIISCRGVLYTVLYLEKPSGKGAALGGSVRKRRVHSWLCGVLKCSIPSEAHKFWDFSGGMMERPGTLKGDDKDLNIASATLTSEHVSFCRMGIVRHFSGSLKLRLCQVEEMLC